MSVTREPTLHPRSAAPRRRQLSAVKGALAAAALAAALWSAAGAPGARAAGSGPAIALGDVNGTAVVVSATTTATDPYKGFNLHVHAEPSAGVSGLSIAANIDGSTLPSQDAQPFCVAKAPAGLPNDKVYGCVVVGAGSTSAAGVLANFVVHAQGSGCVVLSLVTQPGSDTLDTFTINAADATKQANTVDTATTKGVIVGGGSPSDCAAGGAAPASTPPPASGSTPGAPPLSTQAASTAQPPSAAATPGAPGGGAAGVATPPPPAGSARQPTAGAGAGGVATTATNVPLSAANAANATRAPGSAVSAAASSKGGGGGFSLWWIVAMAAGAVAAAVGLIAYVRRRTAR